MKSLFLNYNINLSEKQVKLFEKYFELLIFYNKKFNITAITDKNEVVVKHFIDSILPVDKLKGYKLIDIGAGGGFPSIPLKIINDHFSMTLLEATGKKCEFLRTVIKELGLSNMEVVNSRAEILSKDENYREKFDVSVARAVARLNTLMEYAVPFVKVGGQFVAYKGNATEELTEIERAEKLLGVKLKSAEKYTLDGAERTLVVFDKIYKTDKKYPRGNGKERKNPL